MQPYAVKVPGSVVTKQTAHGYLFRVLCYLDDNITPESCAALDHIEEIIVNAGFMTWEHVEQLEIAALQTAERITIAAKSFHPAKDVTAK